MRTTSSRQPSGTLWWWLTRTRSVHAFAATRRTPASTSSCRRSCRCRKTSMVSRALWEAEGKIDTLIEDLIELSRESNEYARAARGLRRYAEELEDELMRMRALISEDDLARAGFR